MIVARTSRTSISISAILAAGMALSGCTLPGKPKPGPEVPRPQAVLAFEPLYNQNCAACHGADGQNGSATDLANPEYQALIDDATLRDITAKGQKGTLMPGFAVSAHGMLIDQQIDVLVHGMRERWAKQNALAGLNAPPYKAAGPGDPSHGQAVYNAGCARCHGAVGEKAGPAGSVLESSFLAIVSPQTLRTTVIAGRPDIGQPDWRGDIPGRALTDPEITDLIAWMIAQRPPSPGRPYPDLSETSDSPGNHEPKPVSRPPADRK